MTTLAHHTPEFGLPRQPRRYRCTNCGNEQQITTNHTDVCFDHCRECSWKGTWGNNPGAIMFGTWYRPFEYLDEITEE